MAAKGNLSDILIDLSTSILEDSSATESFIFRFSFFYDEFESHYHADITQMVFFDLKDEEKEILDRNLSEILTSLKYRDSEKSKKIERNLLKVQDHIQLCLNQKKLIDEFQTLMLQELREAKKELEDSRKESETIQSQVEKYETKIENMESTLEKMKSTLEETETKLKETTNKSSRIYAEFIVILGIFTTIIFATFGGLEISGNIFSNLNEVSTGKLMVFGSLIVAAIVLILFMLLNGISKLTKFSLSSCECGPEDTCNHNVFQKHPSMVIANMILLYIFILGITQYFLPYEELLRKAFTNLDFSLPLWLIIIITILYITFMSLLYAYKRNSQKTNRVFLLLRAMLRENRKNKDKKSTDLSKES